MVFIVFAYSQKRVERGVKGIQSFSRIFLGGAGYCTLTGVLEDMNYE